MMIIVPAFTQGEDSQYRVVAAVVRGVVSSIASQMSHRVYRSGGMKQNCGANEKSPGQHLHAVGLGLGMMNMQPLSKAVKREEEHQRHEPVESIKPSKLWISGEVRDSGVVGDHIFGRGDPGNMRPQKTACHRRVDIFLGVRGGVVLSVMGCPPQGTSLNRHTAYDREDKLHGAGCFESTMRKVSVIEARDGEHAKNV